MSLSTLIRKRDPVNLATATVAVANPTEPTMTAGDGARVNAWLDHIGATDPIERLEVVEKCKGDPDALAYFLKRHAEDCTTTDTEDDGRP